MSTLSTQAFVRIKEQVTRGQLRPGDVLSERKLAAELGMSKTPVRAALARLEAEGLVAIAPQRGVVVASPGLGELADCFELRGLIEPYVVRQVAGRLSDAQERDLRKRVKAIGVSLRRRETANYVQRDMELHTALAACLGNREIERVMGQMADRICTSIAVVIDRNPDRLKVGHDEHERMVEQLIAGDGEAAAALMVEHLERGKRSLFPRNL